MATVAIMVGGAVLNAATFIGGNYLAKYLSGDSGQAVLDEKKRHDLALEKYQRDYAQYQKDRMQLLDWIAEQDRKKNKAFHNFQDTDAALALYNQTHQAKVAMPEGAPVLGLLQAQPAAEEWRAALHRRQHPGPWICRLSLLVNAPSIHEQTTHGRQTLEDLLQPQEVLVRDGSHQTTSYRSQGL